MDVGFNDVRGKLIWTLPDDATQLINQTQQDKQGQVVDVFQNALGIMALFLMRAMGNARLARHLEAQMNLMTDLLTLEQLQAQQQANQ